MIAEQIAYMKAHALMVENRLKCECDKPLAGVFDGMQWTTCQRCEKLLSRQEWVNRK
jgi:hypothetical protein